jgi:hypothetical protein
VDALVVAAHREMHLFSLFLSMGALILWVAFGLRVLRAWTRLLEHRPVWAVLPVIGVMAALGMSAMSLYVAATHGLVTLPWEPEDLLVIASLARGGLLMGGVIAFVFYAPET